MRRVRLDRATGERPHAAIAVGFGTVLIAAEALARKGAARHRARGRWLGGSVHAQLQTMLLPISAV